MPPLPEGACNVRIESATNSGWDGMNEIWGTVGPKGSEVFSCDGMDDWEWARCHWGACENFVCHRLSDIHCWVHADGQPTGAEFVYSLKVLSREPVAS